MTTRAPAVLIKRQQKSLTNVAKIVWPIVLLQKLVRCMIAFDEGGDKVKSCTAPLVHRPSMTIVISCHLPLSEAHSFSFFVEDKVKLKLQKAFDHVHRTYSTLQGKMLDVLC